MALSLSRSSIPVNSIMGFQDKANSNNRLVGASFT
jgi:hypothetical protein